MLLYSLHSLNPNYSVLDGVDVVQIWGNWCGPNWTDGKPVSANHPSVNFNGPVVDNLDAACRSHDKDCAHPDGCSREADLKLIRAAWPYTFDVMNPNRAYAAKGIMTAITLASFTRSR